MGPERQGSVVPPDRTEWPPLLGLPDASLDQQYLGDLLVRGTGHQIAQDIELAGVNGDRVA